MKSCYSSKSDLQDHVKAVHVGLKSFCRHCTREFGRNSDRNCHERDCHGIELKLKRSCRVKWVFIFVDILASFFSFGLAYISFQSNHYLDEGMFVCWYAFVMISGD